MACDINELLADATCLAVLPTMDLVAGSLWCGFSPTPPTPGGPSLWNPDVNSGISNPEAGPIVNPEQ